MVNRRLYYRLKPYLPWRFRMAMRRILARRKRNAFQAVWPINEATRHPPVNWPGWPEGKKFAFVLTHDVEGPGGVAKCRQLMELERKLGFRSSFNFIPAGDYVVSRELREELSKNGFEVGVHDFHHDGKLYESRSGFSEKAKGINRHLQEWGATGFRSGFMLHELDWLHDLNILYDASTFDTDPFEPQPDGAGTIFPFWVPQPDDRLQVQNSDDGISPAASASRPGYVELPYTLAQDSTLFLVLREPTPEIWFRKLDWVAGCGGMALVNVHPDYLQFPGEADSPSTFPVEHYVALLEHVRDSHAGSYWQPLPKELAGWYRKSCPPATSSATLPTSGALSTLDKIPSFKGRRAAVVLYAHYASDQRPRREAEALHQAGMEVDVICLSGNGDEPQHVQLNGVNVYHAPLKRRRGGKFVYVFQYGAFVCMSMGWLALRSFRRRYDLVHVHNMPDFLVFSALVPKILGARVILDLHDPMPELMMTIFGLQEKSFAVRLLKFFEKTSIGFAHLVLTPNVTFKNVFASRSCVPGKIKILMNSPDEETFQFRPVPPLVSEKRDAARPFKILYHGEIVERHGLDLVVSALAQVRGVIPQANLMICGERTPFLDGVMQSVQKLGLQDAVRYLGVRTQKQITEAIDECDLGVIPNRRSIFTDINMPTRIFECLALGKPVIAPRTRGVQDYFSTENLIFFESGNTDDLARKIESVYLQPRETREIVARGQAVYLKHRWNRERSELLDLTGGLLGFRNS